MPNELSVVWQPNIKSSPHTRPSADILQTVFFLWSVCANGYLEECWSCQTLVPYFECVFGKCGCDYHCDYDTAQKLFINIVKDTSAQYTHIKYFKLLIQIFYCDYIKKRLLLYTGYNCLITVQPFLNTQQAANEKCCLMVQVASCEQPTSNDIEERNECCSTPKDIRVNHSDPVRFWRKKMEVQCRCCNLQVNFWSKFPTAALSQSKHGTGKKRCGVRKWLDCRCGTGGTAAACCPSVLNQIPA